MKKKLLEFADEELLEHISESAKRNRRSVSAEILFALEFYLTAQAATKTTDPKELPPKPKKH